MHFTSGDMVTVNPPGRAAIARARVQHEVNETLIKAHQRHPSISPEPRSGLTAEPRSHAPPSRERSCNVMCPGSASKAHWRVARFSNGDADGSGERERGQDR
jgi:hypothetical protein